MTNANRISRIPVASLGATAGRVVETAKESSIPDVVNDTAFTNLEQKSNTYRQSINKKLYSDLTDDAVQLDKNRDSFSTGMRQYVKSMLNSPVQAMHDAAVVVSKVLDRYVGVEALPYGDESENLHNMVAELRAPSLQSSVATLNLKDWIDAIDKANNDFEHMILQRSNDEVVIQKVKSASSQRRDLEQALRDYFEYVHALVVIKKTEEYIDFEQKLYKVVETTAAPLLRATPDDKK